jgi:hypothetical protein
MSTAHHDEKFAKMAFSKVYPLYLAKVQRKGRTEKDLLTVISWLTGYSETNLLLYASPQSLVTFQDFFDRPECIIHPNACLITGNICGYRVESILNPLTQKVRYMDKLVDELAMGKSLDDICRGKNVSVGPHKKSTQISGSIPEKKMGVAGKAKTAKQVAVKSFKAKPKTVNGVQAKVGNPKRR